MPPVGPTPTVRLHYGPSDGLEVPVDRIQGISAPQILIAQIDGTVAVYEQVKLGREDGFSARWEYAFLQ